MVAVPLASDGFAVLAYDPSVALWAATARRAGLDALEQDRARRHGGTWFVGVDALPNAVDGSIGGVPLAGGWLDHVKAPAVWHRAQLSVVFPGYPQRDADESEAAHTYRRVRDAAHVDGLLPEGPAKRRHLREPHGFIAGLPLDDVAASPLVVWAKSHLVMRAAFTKAFAGHPPHVWPDLDVTDIYQAARRQIFDTCARIELTAQPGQVILLDRHLLHGVAPWRKGDAGQMRMNAYFRPLIDLADWL